MTRMATYAIDLRQKILHAYERQLGSPRAWAAVFGVRRACIAKWLRPQRPTGEMAPQPHAGGQQPRRDTAAHGLLRRLVREHPDATLEELCTQGAAEAGMRVSVPTMCRVLQHLGLPPKKSRFTPRNVRQNASNRPARTTVN